ncbi:MAG: hypothetical protein V8R43_09745 [Dorea sp.]
MKKVGVSTEEKNLSYYRFFEQDLAEIPQEKLQILKGGPSQIKAVPFEEKNLFLAGKDEAYCQTGYGIMEDGTGFVCNTTYMPGVTGEMLDWWFPWHSVGSDLRYKIWDPDGPLFCESGSRGLCLRSGSANESEDMGREPLHYGRCRGRTGVSETEFQETGRFRL